MWKEKWFSIWWTVFVWPSVHNSLASCLLPWQVGQSNVSNTTYNISIWYLIMRKRKNLHFPCNTTLILIICLYFQHYDNVLIRQNLFTHTICLFSFSSYCRYSQCYKLCMKVSISGQNLLETVSNGGSAPSPVSRSTGLCSSIVMTVLVKCVTPIKINVFSFTKWPTHETMK